MEKFIINGGNELHGSVEISGAKNAVVAIIPAAILADDISVLENVPDIEDVRNMFEIIESIGGVVERTGSSTYRVDTRGINTTLVKKEIAEKLRASYYLMGALLGRYRHFKVAMPGGCDLGARPIDLHIKGFEALDAKVTDDGYYVEAKTDGLKGGSVYFNTVSVGATINTILAAVKADGITIIENAAREPHIIDIANYLNKCGADIRGAGTNTIKIRGVEHLHGCEHSVIPDQIEAGTYMLACAAAGGDIIIKNVIPRHLECITQKLLECGVYVDEFVDSVRVHTEKRPTKCDIITSPYPGFPTDVQPQFAVLLTLCDGVSTVTESIWSNRFRYADQLMRMGADIKRLSDNKTAVIKGVESLHGALVKADDLRAGAAMIIAGLAAEGRTEIEQIFHIDRGYEHVVEKFRGLGADIVRIDSPDNPQQTVKIYIA